MTTNEKCFECNAGMMIPGMVTLTGVRNGEEFSVSVPGLACAACGYKTIDNKQSGEFTRAVSDAYKSAHGLLLGAELRERREAWLGMSQQAFADHLGVGIASIKRWESGQIQDRAMDELIRLKTDPQAARENLKILESQVPEDHLASSIKLGDQAVFDLLFSAQPTFTSKPQMKMGKLKFTKLAFRKGEPVAA